MADCLKQNMIAMSSRSHIANGPITVLLAVPLGTVSAGPLKTEGLNVPIWVRIQMELIPCKRCQNERITV